MGRIEVGGMGKCGEVGKKGDLMRIAGFDGAVYMQFAVFMLNTHY